MKTCFDKDWRFHLGEEPTAFWSEWLKREFDDQSWRRLDLPHDWSIEGPFSKDHPCGGRGGSLPGGVGWYRKRFSLPEQERGRKVTVQFDGVYKNCDVWINGQHLGAALFQYEIMGETYLIPTLKEYLAKNKNLEMDVLLDSLTLNIF